MAKFLICALFIVMLSVESSTQSLFEYEQLKTVFHSGKSKVTVSENGKLHSIWHIDTVARTIAQYSLLKTRMIPGGPVYNDTYSTSESHTYFFNEFGDVDSILNVYYGITMSPVYPHKMDSVPTITVSVYSYAQGENWAMNRKHYTIKNGQRKLSSTDYFGYDSDQNLVVVIRNEGTDQLYFERNDKGQIVKEISRKTVTLNEYNENGRVSRRLFGSAVIDYRYNEDLLVIEEVVTGKYARTTTFVYE